MKKIVLDHIAGYATERTVWQLIQFISERWKEDEGIIIQPDMIVVGDAEFYAGRRMENNKKSVAYLAPECKGNDGGNVSEKAEVWSVGALAFYMLMGKEIFDGKGGSTQYKNTQIPRISSSHCSDSLSGIIYRCLNYEPTERPTMSELKETATRLLQRRYAPTKRLVNRQGKSFMASIVKFWPEEITCMTIFLFSLLFSVHCHAQSGKIDAEMKNIVQLCKDLRSSSNEKKVKDKLRDDTKWTIMDELVVDKSGECTIDEKVDMFGLNDIAFRYAKLRGGVTNTGGRFRNGKDPRYNYSFIEITVRKRATVNYDINGREGYQVFAIVPHKEGASFNSYINMGEKITSKLQDGVAYIFLPGTVKQSDVLKLTIQNTSQENMAFVIINYNSRSK